MKPVMKLTILTGPFTVTIDLSIDALEGQIRLIEEIGYSSQRRSHIERLRAQATYLSRVIENSEESFIGIIENFSKSVIDQTAEERDFLTEVSRVTTDQDLVEIAGEARETHNKMVKFLGKAEQEEINNFREMIAEKKSLVKKLLQQIDNLRIC